MKTTINEETMYTLILRHVRDSDPAAFQVVRQPDGSSSQPCAVPSPVGYPVEGRPETDLLQDLRWYLEDFLALPSAPYRDLAGRILAARDAWGTELFNSLFDGDRNARRAYDAATAEGFGNLRLRVVSEDPGVLGWPWEALRDPEAGVLAHECAMERRLEANVRDPLPLPENLPRERIHILLVTARPFERDVGFRTVSLPLVDLIDQQGLPAQVTLLRPPTLDALDRHLSEHPGHYHLLHFDGHGSYTADAAQVRAAIVAGNPHSLRAANAPVGRLVFERQEVGDDGERGDPRSGEELAAVLRRHRLPAVVLNACQSAMIDATAEDPFASVAAALIKAGVRDVVAMSHSLWVSAARELLPAFYESLFRDGDVGAAVSAGRRRLLIERNRLGGSLKPEPLEDWHIPVHYRNDPEEGRLFDFKGDGAAQEEPLEQLAIPEAVADSENPYGLIGRDSAIQALEAALRGGPAGILIHGIGGVGKTTLAKGFVRWLALTGGLDGALWFRFDESRRTAESVINEIGMTFFGMAFGALDTEAKFTHLAKLKAHRLVMVWDNFEVVAGINASGQSPTIPDDANLLRRLLQTLRGGNTKVVITSRSDEDWLGANDRRKLPLGGLKGEERWALCRAIAEDQGLDIHADRDVLGNLLDAIDGHPLIMRVLLPLLETYSPDELKARWRGNLTGLELGGDEALQRQLYATLQLVEERLPADLRPLLVPLALHEGHVDADYLEHMAGQVQGAPQRPAIDRCLAVLAHLGVLTDLGSAVYALHPALTGWLRGTVLAHAESSVAEAWTRAFVDSMGRLADGYAPKPLHEQRTVFHLFGANFHYARQQAKRLGLARDVAALTQALGAYAQNTLDWTGAAALFDDLARYQRDREKFEGEAAAYHQLGGSPGSSGTSRRPSSGIASRWRSREAGQ